MSALRREDGFTLMELVVVIPMLTLVLGGISVTLVTLMRWNNQTTEQTTQQATIRSTFDGLIRDLRSALPVTQGGVPVVAADSTSITFYAPDRYGGAAPGSVQPFHLREVAYRFSGGALQKQQVTSTSTWATVTATIPWGSWSSASGTFPLGSFPSSTGWQTLIGTGLVTGAPLPQLTSASFTYYGQNAQVLTAPLSSSELQDLRTIEVDATANNGGQQGKSTTYSATATIRENQLH